MQPRMVRSLALGLLLLPATGEAQRIPHEVVVHDARLYSDIAGRRTRFRYRGPMLEVVRRTPRRGFVVTERYRRFPERVRSLRMPHNEGRRWLRRRGFRPMTLYVKGGNYYRRVWASPRARGNPTLRPVVVWRRHGVVYRIQSRYLPRSPRHRRR